MPTIPTRIRRILFTIMTSNVVVWGIAAASFVLHHHSSGPISTHSFTAYLLLSPSEEMSVGTWLSSMLWVIVFLMTSMYAVASASKRGAWLFFGFISLVASIDEFVMLHERLQPVGEKVAPGAELPFGFVWVVPGAVICLLVAVSLIRLVFALPSLTKWGLILAGAIFVGSAVGMEYLAGRYSWSIGGLNDVYWRFMMIEEFLEVTALAVAIASLGFLMRWDPKHNQLKIDLVNGVE